MPGRSREKPDRMAVGEPVLAKQFQGGLGQPDIAIFAAFTLMNMDHHAAAIDIRDLQADALLQAQPARVNGG
jgi:hypothetical protein